MEEGGKRCGGNCPPHSALAVGGHSERLQGAGVGETDPRAQEDGAGLPVPFRFNIHLSCR